MSNIPEGWTDDMTIPLPPDRTVEELVEFVIQAATHGTPDSVTEQELIVAFSLSQADAALARDRTFGGIVRAATRNPLNCPIREKDPVAWTSFQRATTDPSIIAAIYPQYAG